MRTVIALAAFAVSVSMAQAATPDVFLHDVLHRQDYKATWLRLLRSDQRLPKWLTRYRIDLDVPSQAGTVIKVDGADREFYRVPKPHDRGSANFGVMFRYRGKGAVGVLVEHPFGGKVTTTPVGDPTRAETDALVKALDVD